MILSDKWTPMQRKAITRRGNILVSAAAGSGKTAVLVERVIKLIIEDGISADKLLIVTFTNAAAAEMRSRIEKRIHEIIQETNDVDELDKLQEQKYLLQKADICTIDSFCINLVRKNFEKCGVQPDFSVSDLSQQVDTCNAIMSDLISPYLENPSEEFIHLLELTNCEYDEKELTDVIKNLYEYSQLLPSPENFIRQLLVPYETEFDTGHPWYDKAFDVAINRLQTAQKIAKLLKKSAPNDDYMPCVEEILDNIQKFEDTLSKKDWDGVFDNYDQLIKLPSVPKLSKKDPDYDEKEPAHTRFRDIKNKIPKVYSEKIRPIFPACRTDVQDDIKKDYPTVKLLTELVTEYSTKLFEAFCQKNEFTFGEIEQMAYKLLCEDDEAKSLCEYYDAVLVDEFQDVNNLQDTLFNILSNNEEKLFVVGDVKQSIYGFRGSNPTNFLNKKNRYIPIDKAEEDKAQKIILSDNFRSRKGVCDCVNFFFSKLLAGQCSDIIYNEDEYLNAHDELFIKNNVSATDILLIDKLNDNKKSPEFESDELCEDTVPLQEDSLVPDDAESVEYNRLELEAHRVAEYVVSVMNEGEIISDEKEIKDEKGNIIGKEKILRAAKYCDFAILLSSLRGKADVFAEALREKGIPVALGGDVFMESREISTVMSLLQVIDNPQRDVELFDVMMSPIFAFDAEEMAKIRVNQKYGSLYSAVIKYSVDDDIKEKIKKFKEKIAELRRDAAVLSIDRLISKIIHSTDILNIMSSLDGGKTRRANLFALIKYAKEFEARFGSGIYGFIKYMNSLPENSFKGVNTSGDNAVRIMTMHGSKGLQFPVCIVANLTGQFNESDSIGRVLYNEKDGIAFKYYSETQKQDKETIGRIVLSDLAKAKNIEERTRLLYVAMTRAVDRLCVVCSDKELDKTLQTLADDIDEEPMISRTFLRNSNNMASWILSCALIHPDGTVLRERINTEIKPIESDARLNIIMSDSETFKVKGPENNKKDSYVESEKKILEFFVNQIKDNLEWEYPYNELRNLQAKASVSRLVHRAEGDKYAFESKPAFMLGDKLVGAARGSATHHVMQFINFKPEMDIEKEIEYLCEQKFITEHEANSVDKESISKFFESDVYKRIILCGEDKVHREMRFLSEIPANQIDNTVSVSANIIVQGAVDLCFEENDGIVVLDFKTDRVKDMSELVKSYGEQLEIYSMAAEKRFAKPVKEKIIYSFHLGESISF